MSAPAVFRAEDQELLEELEDELVIGRLFTAFAPPGASALPSRAGGLVSHVRRMEGGRQAVARVVDGADARAELSPFVLRDDLRHLAPEYLHHLAIFFDRVARAIASAIGEKASGPRPRGAALRDAYLDARTRSTAAFIALHDRTAYLTEYARRVLGGAPSSVDVQSTALTIVAECVDDLARAARDGARVLSRGSELALEALARVRTACRMSGAEERTQAAFARRAESARMGAIDEALAPLLDALAEARVREAPVRELVTIFAKIHAVWVWSSGDDTVERFAVDGVLDFCWEIRRKHDLSGIGLLLAPCVPLYESLANRIETDPKHHIGYASKCAQVYCFRSDAETQSEKELAFAERAIKLCSTHRNGRATVAHILCNRAIAKLSTALVTRSVIEAAKRDIARAEELWPTSTRIAAAKAKLAGHAGK
ncbi:MAG: hypothetical protein U0414_21340 [Polyangiaceae bacterium]